MRHVYVNAPWANVPDYLSRGWLLLAVTDSGRATLRYDL